MCPVKSITNVVRRIQKGNHKLSNNKGFTLIELIAILLILGVLIGIVAPRMIGVDKTVEDRIKVVETAAETRKDIYNKYFGIEGEK